MNKLKLFIIPLVILFFSMGAFAQNRENKKDDKKDNKKENKKDTVAVFIHTWQNGEDVSSKIFQVPDTLADYFQISNPIIRSSFANNYLGNIGLAAMPAIYTHQAIQMKSSHFFPSLFEDFNESNFLLSRYVSMYFLRPENIKLYNTNKPFTNLLYTAGSRSREEQQFKVIHTQNISPFFNFGLLFNGINSLGEFESQTSKLKSMGASMNFDNKRYKAWLIFTHNKLENEHSGGFSIDTTNTQKNYFPTKSMGISTENYNQHISFGQSLFFMKRMRTDTIPLLDSLLIPIDSLRTDSLQTDSLQTDTLQTDSLRTRSLHTDSIALKLKTIDKKENLHNNNSELKDNNKEQKIDSLQTAADTIKPNIVIQKLNAFFGYGKLDWRKYDYQLAISHKFSYDKNTLVYRDNGDMSYFYDNIYRNDKTTYDSTYYHTLNNAVQIKHYGVWADKIRTNTYIGISNEANKYHYLRDFIKLQNDSLFSSTNVHGGFYGDISKMLSWNFAAKYYFSGHKKDNYKITLKATKRFALWNDTINLSYQLSEKQLKPDIFEQRFFSNYFRWNNNFHDKKIRNSNFTVNYPSIRLALTFSYAELWHHIFFNKNAEPEQYKEKITIQTISLNKDFYFWYFRWKNKIVYQQSDNPKKLPLPEICAYSSFYFEKKLFGVLNVQLGFDAFFNSLWHSYKYMPATGQFYVQNDVKTGDIPVLDVFINLKLRNRALIFFKGENIYELFSNEKYFPTVEYPIDGTAFKFGVSWWFHD